MGSYDVKQITLVSPMWEGGNSIWEPHGGTVYEGAVAELVSGNSFGFVTRICFLSVRTSAPLPKHRTWHLPWSPRGSWDAFWSLGI